MSEQKTTWFELLLGAIFGLLGLAVGSWIFWYVGVLVVRWYWFN